MNYFLRAILRIFTPLRIALILGIAAFLWFLVFGDQGIYQLNRLSMMKKRLALQRETLKSDIERLTKERAFLRNPKNLEPVIRKELGYIRPGEIVYQEKEEK